MFNKLSGKAFYETVTMSQSLAIVHNTDQQCFSLVHQPQARLQYRIMQANEVHFFTVEVPESLRGQGVAALLLDSALAWATNEGLAISTSCSYIAARLAK